MARTDEKAQTLAAWPVLLLIASFLAPSELSLYLGGLRLPPHRVAILLLLPLAAYRIMTARDLKLRAFDWIVILYNVWTVGIFVYHADHDGLVFGGSLALESVGGYLIARAWIRSLEDFQAAFKTLILAVLAAGLIALPETLFGQHMTHDLLQNVTGHIHPRAIERRLGLTRAYGTFDHPIHLGTFCASLVALAWYTHAPRGTRNTRIAIVALSTLTALSSAPMLCVALQVGFIVWDQVTRSMKNRIGMTLSLLVGLYIIASLVMTRSPIMFIATGMTLDSWTGYYRTVIWEWGMVNIWNNPWTGIGLGDWERPWWMVSASVDAFWLLIAMRGGAPAFLLLAIALALFCKGVVGRGSRHHDPRVRRIALGWMMSLIALSLAACTVHYWNVLYAYFFFFVGLAGWIADPGRASTQRRAAANGATVIALPRTGRGRRAPQSGGYASQPWNTGSAAAWAAFQASAHGTLQAPPRHAR
jgi:hypothetical protein